MSNHACTGGGLKSAGVRPGTAFTPPGRARSARARSQQGVVLVIALVMLVVVSLIASVSMRNAASTETASARVRTTELAMQAAEIALRHCQASLSRVLGFGEPTFTTTFTLSKNILPVANPPLWPDLANWDNATTAIFVLPLPLLNDAGLARTTYQRPPECMVEPLPVLLKDEVTPSHSSAFVVTARGFGPEVADRTETNGRPVGTEVWLQVHLPLE